MGDYLGTESIVCHVRLDNEKLSEFCLDNLRSIMVSEPGSQTIVHKFNFY